MKAIKRWSAIVSAACLAACVFQGSAGADALPAGKPGVGDTAPLFAAEDLEGRKTVLDELLKAGKVVLLNFWGLRCANCIEEIGYLNRMHEKYGGKEVAFLGVNVDGVKAEVIRQMMPKMSNVPRFTVLPDPGFTIPDMYNLGGAPLSFVIARDGKILCRHEDFKPGDEKELEKALEKAVSGEK